MLQGSSGKLSIENLKILVMSSGKVSTISADIFDDGKINLLDLPKLPKLLNALGDLPKVEFLELWPELKDLDDVERAELASLFSLHFNITNDTIEGIVEQGLALLLEAVSGVLSVVNVGRKIKALQLQVGSF